METSVWEMNQGPQQNKDFLPMEHLVEALLEGEGTGMMQEITIPRCREWDFHLQILKVLSGIK